MFIICNFYTGSCFSIHLINYSLVRFIVNWVRKSVTLPNTWACHNCRCLNKVTWDITVFALSIMRNEPVENSKKVDHRAFPRCSLP